ncbi:hypothetical protein CRE_16244 [Caenorhabditis remanei]|uniref:Protein kinase domain-containing protein n=1 Tax=Caenorhabditis remanei TaxID=31234 RepID=E3N2H1_CAERE|nr:hypothetical protein CRE_16244 [Caenorhabditis remanei]
MEDEEDNKPDRQVESVRLTIGEDVVDKDDKEKKRVWTTGRVLGKGAFGTVYHVTEKTTKQEAALKIERMTAGDNLLKIEREIMQAMKEEPTAIHIFDDGIYNDYRFIVMTLCGPDLQKIAEMMNNTFSPETIIRVSIRTLLAVKTFHEYEYVHRDLKPCNFAVDYDPNSLHVYIFDYGMARRYARTDKSRWYLRRPRENVQFRGTARYCSVNMHKRKELGRVDDVWSWFFMMMEMHKQLPWHDVQNQDKIEAIKEFQLPEYISKDPFYCSFKPILDILNGAGYADRPDYTKIFEILLAKLEEIGGKLSGPMEYDAARINAMEPKPGESVRQKVESVRMDEPATKQYLTDAFNKVVIPGGSQYVIPEWVDFFGNLNPKKPEKEKTEEHKKRIPKSPQSRTKTKKTAATGKANLPTSSVEKKDVTQGTVPRKDKNSKQKPKK